MQNKDKKARIGIVGSGFVSRGLTMLLHDYPSMRVSRVLTRTPVSDRTDFSDRDLLTNSVDELIDQSDIVVECTGDAIYATDIVEKLISASLPVVTMDSELQITTGSYFAGRGIFTESEGDQPGCVAALRESAIDMGFKPTVYGNIKGFLNHSPAVEEMKFWAKKQNFMLDKTISFTDGTKLQIEQALVANGIGAGLACTGMLGIKSDNLDVAANALAEKAQQLDYPICDYVLSGKLPPGVFIVAYHTEQHKLALENYRLGAGPFYLLLRNYHLCHLEIPRTIRRVLNGGGVLLNNGVRPAISVAAVAKRRIRKDELIEQGTGSFDVRGVAIRIRENRQHVPIGLLSHAVVRRQIEPDQQVCFDDVELQQSKALNIWRKLISEVI